MKELIGSELEFDEYIGEIDKNRVINAIRGEEIDRVPNMEVLIEDKHVEKMLNRYAGNTLSATIDLAKGEADLSSDRPMYPDDYKEICSIIGQDMVFVGSMWVPFKKVDVKGRVIQISDKSIKNREDFKKVILPDLDDINRVVNFVKEYKKSLKKTGIGIVSYVGCPLQTLYEMIVGLDDFMIMCYDDRKLVIDMMEIASEYSYNLCKACINEGVDIIEIADDIAYKTGLLFSPKLLKEIWINRMRRIVEPAIEANIPIIFHSDGKVDEIIPDLIDIGVDCIQPLEPYSNDYKVFKKRYGKNLALWGNMDIGTLQYGSREEIESDVKQHMEILKPGCGYIAGSSHSIINAIPYENFIIFINAIHKYGVYS